VNVTVPVNNAGVGAPAPFLDADINRPAYFRKVYDEGDKYVESRLGKLLASLVT
jgi:hypothetical protein